MTHEDTATPLVGERIIWILCGVFAWNLIQQVTVAIPGNVWLSSSAAIVCGVIIGFAIREDRNRWLLMASASLLTGFFGWSDALLLVRFPQFTAQLVNALVCGGLGGVATWVLTGLQCRYADRPLIAASIVLGALIAAFALNYLLFA